MQANETREQKPQWIKYYEMGLGIYTVILAAILIGIVLMIYLNGTSPSNLSEDGLYLQPVYSRELVAGYLRSLLPWFFVWVITVAAGVVFYARRPVRKEFVPVSPEETFDRLMRQAARKSAGQHETGESEKSQSRGIWKWVDSFEKRNKFNVSDLLHEYEFTESDEIWSAVESLRQEQKKWYYVNLASVFICGLCLGEAGSYLLNREHFTSWDLEQVMGAMLRAVLPALVIAFAALCARSEWKKKSLERMIPQLRKLVAVDAETRLSKKKVAVSGNSKDSGLSGARESDPVTEKVEKPDKPEWSENSKVLKNTRLVIAAVAVVFLVIGVNNGGMRDVLVKAINICTECIGLG